MSQKISRLNYQISITNSSELKEKFFSPNFCSNNNLYWKLCVKPTADEESYGVFIIPVPGPDEINWRNRSKLFIKLYAKEISGQTYNLYNNAFHVPADTSITKAYGCAEAFEKSSLRNGILLIGVTFENFENEGLTHYNNNNDDNVPLDYLPKNLVNAWKDHLYNFQPVDIEFIVKDKTFYACSSIISKRSSYFANVLSGNWAESTNNNIKIETDEILLPLSDNVLSTKIEKSNYQIKHRIEITDFTPDIFAIMLEYLYTNQINWINKDDKSITIGLFCLADRYLLSDLRERAKMRIFSELNLTNVSEIMFGLVPKYEDLKDPILHFMIKNFEQISETQGFKNILSKSSDYYKFNDIMSELLSEYFKFQKGSNRKTNNVKVQSELNI
ncbi:uncharacterized protein OCT59_008906 [Rhizophagus irregularis]|uniref:BTB domain-containing protein n=3 Tax=Rhizophagus irregularis TaxID=588596 RepID=A0A015KPS4_RHIIW|nr:hypothetical protein GLOIN_2v1761981 [Rhizophagus irregularis DAOM 181602=DAOM 197198]EXX69574.1 hypothetical protein RirG_094710 [Rhizophagus irregularis DAOM 197198w]POG82587.1 hypothetical protein GLOIN_2v1761981 [Rhizophagus irregularis DAOM 181602=DAOM 197198]UZO17555.1 hypothetical protein OCT59_008906 [Rhizophagus irregularis]GBC24203.1 speckle-type POZ protein B-like isoform X1 [Rhizophagus irregularis DAOM 181602=DAOM 197198]|eukprot:XP_025189453.1 hypothetical protein GLOIN_2v1761981 [Rhizophagus irregularis DAOM 181602=DAOM 197198]